VRRKKAGRLRNILSQEYSAQEHSTTGIRTLSQSEKPGTQKKCRALFHQAAQLGPAGCVIQTLNRKTVELTKDLKLQ
jgi:hypothetical protein